MTAGPVRELFGNSLKEKKTKKLIKEEADSSAVLVTPIDVTEMMVLNDRMSLGETTTPSPLVVEGKTVMITTNNAAPAGPHRVNEWARAEGDRRSFSEGYEQLFYSRN